MGANRLQGSEPKPPLVTVVVIGYNQEGYAPLAVRSVLMQTYEHLECIFVDDGSLDETYERVRALQQTDTRLRVYTKQNGGPASARNFGAARASRGAQYVAFLDGDDLYRPEFLAVGIDYLRAHPEAGVVLPGLDFIDAAGTPLPGQRRGYRWVSSSLWLPRRLRDSEAATPFLTFYCGTGAFPFWLGRMQDFRKTEGWDESLWFVEDVDMLCQLAMITEVHAIAVRLVEYRIHSEQITSGTAKVSNRRRSDLSAVQEKWNRRHYPDAARNRILDRACIYYRQMHLPLRAVWVARRALGEFLRAPSFRSFMRLLHLGCLFLRDFLYFKLIFWRSTRRYIATKFYEAQP